ncbi:Phage protein [Vibrio crassostreae]|nr:Phage protein [Vibrio crassostreae]CAK2335103.1 Phage protein [Vibrio crassostreae]CAK2503481.1 Phage protein [Vibrio crassostreae]CAK2911114.1 Phage protein [Vibrio crassostreae]
MELDKFVAETLIAISKGVETAKLDTQEPIDINPPIYGNEQGRMTTEKNRATSDIQFDVALTVEDTAEGGGKISVFGSNVGGSKGNKETLTSRVSFSVPVAFK